MDTQTSTAGAIELRDAPEQGYERADPTDREAVDRISRAASELQDAMDDALLAGLVVEPNFRLIESRLTRSGMRINSFVCRVSVLRKLS